MRLIFYITLLQLTLNMLIANTVVAACKDHIGKTYWIYPENNSLTSTPGKPYRFFLKGNKPIKALVTGCTDFLQSVLQLENGDVAYADGILLGLEQMDSECNFSDVMKRSYFFASDPDAAVRNCEELKAQSAAEMAKATLDKRKATMDKFVAELNAEGVSIGKPLWLKYPVIFDDLIPGLNKLTITRIELDEKTWNTEFIVFVNCAGEEHAGRFISANTLSQALATENLEKKYTIKWGANAVKQIKFGKVKNGMTAEQVKMAWGNPSKINKSIGRWGRHEQWVYGETYFYFENDKLTSWQQSE